MKIVPYPFLTESAIQFLESYLSQDSVVLEFGMGGSTVWLCERVKTVTSVEHAASWYKAAIKAADRTKLTAILRQKPYASVCEDMERESLDLVLVDGRDRMQCLEASLPLLKPGGVMMLDNAHRGRYRKAHAILSKWNVVQTTQRRPHPWYKDANINGKWRTDWWIKPR